MAKPGVDVEIIELRSSCSATVGSASSSCRSTRSADGRCRAAYVEVLRGASRGARLSSMCDDCRAALETNPLRVLDCKVAEDQAAIEAAAADRRPPVRGVPRRTSTRCGASSTCSAFRTGLSTALVRGLDYYTRTIFEVTSGALGAQNSVLGGGRYDGLVRQLGGPAVAGVGFAVGPRAPSDGPARSLAPAPRCDAFLVCLAPERPRPGAAAAQSASRRGACACSTGLRADAASRRR